MSQVFIYIASFNLLITTISLQPLLIGSNDNERGLDNLMASAGRPGPPPPKPAVDNTSCGSLSAANVRKAAGVKSWRYRYMGIFNNTALGPSTGAFHNAEIPMIFGTTDGKAGSAKDTPEQAKLMKNMMRAWAGFAKDPDSGLEKLGWPVWDATSMLIAIVCCRYICANYLSRTNSCQVRI
jgi:hypothetical protein